MFDDKKMNRFIADHPIAEHTKPTEAVYGCVDEAQER
jgi:hypothetical protein